MWYKIKNQHVTLTIIAKPNAKKSQLLKISEQGLHIALHAKPHHGEANKELIAFLAKLFRIPKTQIVLESGESGRCKRVMMPVNEAVLALLNNPTDCINDLK